MSESFESVSQLIESHGMTIPDLEYIVKYLIQEKISPQLAMRRIKSFEVLKQKLEDNSDQDLIKTLKDQLSEKERDYKTSLQEIIDEKTSLETNKQDLETMTDLFDTEREELRNQLKMLQEFQTEDIPEIEDDKTKVLIADLTSTVNPLIEGTQLKEPLIIILNSIKSIVEDKVLNFDTIQFSEAIKQVQKIKSDPIMQKEVSKSQKELSAQKTSKKEMEVIKEKKFSKPVEKKPSIDPQVERVLNLFLDFIKEANTDKDFQNRIDTISEMDEAYEHLGSIGLSQIYSFVSKDLSKKDELIKLLESWKVQGVPR